MHMQNWMQTTYRDSEFFFFFIDLITFVEFVIMKCFHIWIWRLNRHFVQLFEGFNFLFVFSIPWYRLSLLLIIIDISSSFSFYAGAIIFQLVSVYQNIHQAIVKGHRKLAGKLIEEAEKAGGHGYNYLHKEVCLINFTVAPGCWKFCRFPLKHSITTQYSLFFEFYWFPYIVHW